MGHSLLAVEGVHDAAFFGLLLAEQGLKKVAKVSDVPSVWQKLIPSNFPVNDRLDHVVHYPDIYQHPEKSDTSVAIVVGRGQTLIKDELIDAVGILKLEMIEKIAICIDADLDANGAFSEINNIFNEVNEWALQQGVLKKALVIPDKAGEFSTGKLSLGGFVLPNNLAEGALETLLIELANERFGEISKRSSVFIREVDEAHDSSDKLMKRFRKGGNRLKTHTAIVSSFLRPGSNLAVSIEQCDWLPEGDHIALIEVRKFIKDFLA
ncbi:hypothetical protein J5J10_07260 [Ciceribacter sp. L1K23]|uniref:DUF3226 domain-containing protein n=1 Tax=Ciceribacter sp. L1K23 TaxID=2820276 RepID=UPI001B833D10|nr:DUF3226 domain-containing protein [Ciceribacter sp. L1K23]MBR0555476.1 hypothetical protein [Ciceribacter sp. L1K23]